MNAQICQASYVESPWFGGRLAAATTEAAKAAVTTFQSAWRVQQKDSDNASDRDRAIELMADVNEGTLKDIGAPDWLIARANERRHSHHIHLIELFRELIAALAGLKPSREPNRIARLPPA